MMHICVIDSDTGLSHGLHQAIIWTNARILLIGHLGTDFSDILITIYTFSLNSIYAAVFAESLEVRY